LAYKWSGKYHLATQERIRNSDFGPLGHDGCEPAPQAASRHGAIVQFKPAKQPGSR
jgi:hypothetical protein